MTDEQKVREAFERAYSEVNEVAILHRDEEGEYASMFTNQAWKVWQAAVAWMSGGEAVAWQYRNVNDEGPSPFWHECTKEQYAFLKGDRFAEVRELYTHPPRAAEDARDAAGWREMDSAPIDKAIMGAWFGSPEYTEVSPVIYCSERGKWMNPDDMRDDEYTTPDMWHPYPSAPPHRAIDQAIAGKRGG